MVARCSGIRSVQDDENYPVDTTVIHWFRSDLRLDDNPALQAAAESGHRLICLYILDDAAAGRWQAGGASRWWLHHSLAALRDDLAGHGGELLLMRGDSVAILEQLTTRYRVAELHWNRVHEPWAHRVDERVRDALGKRTVCHVHAGQLLFDPAAVRNQQGQPFKVFTPYWKHLLQRAPPAEPAGATVFGSFAAVSGGAALADWQLCPQRPDWAAGFAGHWQPGEAGARLALEGFAANRVQRYASDRDLPAIAGTSRLSAHLHFGEVQPARVWAVIRFAAAARAADARGAEAFLRELGWREFSSYLLHHWPEFPATNFRSEFDNFPWRNDPAALRAWQQGRTGYPLVDAGMRELWQTGWMHNRVRMVAASFLVKHLLIHWHEGAAWFHDTLVDADLANNSAGWQWVAGCGADAAPYFRIFNPVLQAAKFDADGAYVRRWVPELADGRGDYPQPIVDHAAARQRALDAYASIKLDTSSKSNNKTHKAQPRAGHHSG